MVVLSRGRFVTFEGGEGAGKSTQVPMLAEHLRGLGLAVLTTREPGGTAGAEAIRALLVQGGTDRWAASTELLLLAAARDDHVRRVIRPALDAGTWVLCDRFTDSTRVYQGIAGGLGVATVDALHGLILGDLHPHLTLLLDVDPTKGLERRGEGGAETRFERKGRTFHEQVRAGFRTLAQADPQRFAVIDGAAAVGAVAAAIRDAVRQRLGVG